MLCLLFMTKKRKTTLEESVALIQQGENSLRNEIIDSYKPFIAKTVSAVCKRYIHETDDEFSIGLIAFNEAIDKYSPEKGSSLLSFGEVLIKRRVIDYIRKQSRNKTISFEFNNDLQDDDSQSVSFENELSIDEYNRKTEQEHRRDEIMHFQKLLTQYELSFNDLLENSPKHADARKNAILAAKLLIEKEELREILLTKKRLPIKQLEELVDVSRKTLERNRKYIIAMALIFTSDYVYLKDYIKGVLET